MSDSDGIKNKTNVYSVQLGEELTFMPNLRLQHRRFYLRGRGCHGPPLGGGNIIKEEKNYDLYRVRKDK